MTISPEVEAVFIAFKAFGDRIRAINQEEKPFTDGIQQLGAERVELHNALNASAINGNQSENERLAKEITRIDGEMSRLGRFYNILNDQSDEIHRERVEYVETRLGITYEQFRSKYKEIYPAWLAKNQ